MNDYQQQVLSEILETLYAIKEDTEALANDKPARKKFLNALFIFALILILILAHIGAYTINKVLFG